MASSSHTYQTLNNNNKEEEEDEWLKLGLGLGGSNSKSWKKVASNPPSSKSPSCSQIGLGLGFEEGSSLGTKKDTKEGLGSPSDYSNSLLGLPSDHCSKDHCYHHHNDENSMVLWPSSCQIDHDNMQIPCGSHHYSARNPHQSGLWFTLLSFTNQNGEALPQIPKAYIRVKDENMTVLMVKKYLVTKLGLSNEAEVDISCMGESLSPLQTLKHIRDTIWLPRLVESVNSTTLSLEDTHDMSMNHIMAFLYRKHCILN